MHGTPAPEKVVHAMATQSGEVVTPHCANAANALGLIQQVPIKEVYLTSGRSRKFKLGRSEVAVNHAPRCKLALGNGQWASWQGSACLGLDRARACRQIACHLAAHAVALGMARADIGR
jgi:hypothetical protein